jgi:tetratricopeptide (TPR) repeat protein/DNA-binding CsgD family transcriptional regulator
MAFENNYNQREKIYSDHLTILNDPKFTLREIDVIACILHNRGEKKIAALLSISPRTIGTHVHNIMSKCRVHSRESIIDFIEKSGKLHYIKEYYLHLLIQEAFKRQLTKIEKKINREGITFPIYYKELRLEEKTLFCEIEKNFKLANITFLKVNEVDKVTQNVLLLSEELKKFEETDYFLAVSNLLRQIINNKEIDLITQEFENEYQIIKLSLEGKNLKDPSLLGYTTHKEKPFLRKSIAILGLVIFLIILISILFLQLRPNFKNILQQTVARSDFILPHDSILLKRSVITEEIEKKWSNLEGIQTIALVGVGGSGKTTLAREYARRQNNSIVWEINAETINSLSSSLKKLAYFLCKTEEEREEINFIQKIVNLDEKTKRFRLFLEKKLRNYPDWLIIYNNVVSFENIQKYFPYDSKVWGNGKVIITTRDSNIANNSYIANNNIIKVGELTYDKKLELFNKIIGKDRESLLSATEKSELIKLINAIPSFPLDISTAAYYIKREKIPYSKYLEYISQPDEFLSSIQEELLKDVTEYTTTRYRIITTSVKHLITIHPEFKDLLLFLNLLDSQNIPKDLLVAYKDNITVSKFIHELRKFSLITENPANSNNSISTFSIHRSTQAVSLDYLMNLMQKTETTKSLQNMAVAIENYMDAELKAYNLQKIQLLAPHVEMFLNHSNSLDKLDKVDLYYKLGISYFYIATYKKAKELLELANDLYIKYYGENHIKTALASARLGGVYRNIGNDKESKELFEKALIVYKKHYGENAIETAKISIYLGSVYRNIGDYEKAEELIQNGFKIYKENYGEDNINTNWARAYLGSIYNNIGEYNKSKELLEQGLVSYKNYYGTDHTKTAWLSVHLASVYGNIGNYKEAEELLEKAIDVYKRYNGNNCLEVAWSLSHLGVIYNKLGNNKEAIKLLEQSLAIYNDHLDNDHMIVAWATLRLSYVYKDIGNYKQSKNLMEKSLKIYERYYGKNHIQTIQISKDLEKILSK